MSTDRARKPIEGRKATTATMIGKTLWRPLRPSPRMLRIVCHATERTAFPTPARSPSNVAFAVEDLCGGHAGAPVNRSSSVVRSTTTRRRRLLGGDGVADRAEAGLLVGCGDAAG